MKINDFFKKKNNTILVYQNLKLSVLIKAFHHNPLILPSKNVGTLHKILLPVVLPKTIIQTERLIKEYGFKNHSLLFFY